MGDPASFAIEHITRYGYSSPVIGCVMSLCLKPRDDAGQRLLKFEIETDPPAPVNEERDSFGNTKHVLNVHREHRSLTITARSTVAPAPPAPLPASCRADAWDEIRKWRDSFTLWDFTRPSALTEPSPALAAFTARLGIEPEGDPLHAVQQTVEHALFAASTTCPEAPRRCRRWTTFSSRAAASARTTPMP